MTHDEDFLDELPTSPAKSPATDSPAHSEETDMEEALDAASQPASVKKLTGKKTKKVLKKVRRKVKKKKAAAPPTPPADEPIDSLPADDEDTEDDSGPQYDPARDETETEPLAELATLPAAAQEPARTVPRPPTDRTLPVAMPSPGIPSEDINTRWDEFLLSLEHATLIALYEIGVSSMTEFSEYSHADLMKPRGRLTEAQANEVQEKLKICGVELAKKGRGGSLRQGGGQQRIRGLRAPVKNLPPLPEGATAQQKRQHRMMRNRMTM